MGTSPVAGNGAGERALSQALAGQRLLANLRPYSSQANLLYFL
jgi:hypothetical protein